MTRGSGHEGRTTVLLPALLMRGCSAETTVVAPRHTREGGDGVPVVARLRETQTVTGAGTRVPEGVPRVLAAAAIALRLGLPTDADTVEDGPTATRPMRATGVLVPPRVASIVEVRAQRLVPAVESPVETSVVVGATGPLRALRSSPHSLHAPPDGGDTLHRTRSGV